MWLVRALGVSWGEFILFHILPWLEHVMWSKCQANKQIKNNQTKTSWSNYARPSIFAFRGDIWEWEWGEGERGRGY